MAEAEYAAAFGGAQMGVELRRILSNLGYPQPTTPLFCDNKCAIGIATKTVKPKRSKSIDMRLDWIQDRIA